MNRQRQLSSADTHKLPNWRRVVLWEALEHGHLVEVWSGESHLYFAYVDDVTEDGGIVWLIENGTGTRRLYLRGDSVTLYQPQTDLAQLIQY